MHELHLAQDVLRKIEEEARTQNLAKVTFAKVRIGEARVTDPPELKEILANISKGTIADGMQLELDILPLAARCASCQNEFSSAAPRLDCPACGSMDIQITSGQELLVANLK
ncbi:hydrogenase maturation nickel metallochaperone HypA [Candidatus Margulisiibacteriota bacterium]